VWLVGLFVWTFCASLVNAISVVNVCVCMCVCVCVCVCVRASKSLCERGVKTSMCLSSFISFHINVQA